MGSASACSAKMHPNCRVIVAPGRNCAPGDPYASTSSLDDALSGTIHITRLGDDHYGRALATLAGESGDLSCWQLQHGQAIYKPPMG